ncbi:hypothetical protein T4A_2282 [Trichinella pseudospiralis]|uniref:Uncharacterized protein n=1 Tax=Trichinella pseudospiralis TaxID=6337 RepID=A0A0V1DRX9_TRIPS|nr:hypothetical protein T4A_2282 [Trichinella pseudospiralis]
MAMGLIRIFLNLKSSGIAGNRAAIAHSDSDNFKKGSQSVNFLPFKYTVVSAG